MAEYKNPIFVSEQNFEVVFLFFLRKIFFFQRDSSYKTKKAALKSDNYLGQKEAYQSTKFAITLKNMNEKAILASSFLWNNFQALHVEN